MRCPNCNKNINWFQKWKFATSYSFRKTSPCPHCGIKLIYAKWPRIVLYSSLLFILMAMVLLNFPSFSIFGLSYINLAVLCNAVAVIFLILGAMLVRFEIVDANNDQRDS